ncbi:MAG: peptidase, partial [Nitrosopumilaceae archaeon]
MGFGSVHNAFAQGTKTAGGVDVDGTWYAGEGLKKGDYFVYRLCELDLNDCAPFDMKMWVRGETTKGTETLWDFEVVVIDGSKIVKGDMQVGKTAPEPVGESEDLFYYSRAYRSSIVWLSAFATGNLDDLIHGPQAFRDPAWGKVGAIGGSQLIPFRAETVTVPAGTFDTVVVGWYSGIDNEIWIKDDFPFPVKALAYAWVTTGIAPVMYEFELLEYKENVNSSPFADVVSTVEEKELLGCPEFYDYVSRVVEATNTFSMIIEYNYGPENPMPGCEIEWKINFKNKFNQVEFVDQVHY